MPLYEYRCKNCQHHFEIIQKFSDDPVRVCPQCGKEAVEQLISPPAIQFKGSGWYVTDYAHKSMSDPAHKSTSSESSSSGNGHDKGSATGAVASPPASKPASSAPAESK